MPPLYDKKSAFSSDFYGDITQCHSFPHRATKPQLALYYRHALDEANDLPTDINCLVAEFAASDVNIGDMYDVLDHEENMWREAVVLDYENSADVPLESIVHFRYVTSFFILFLSG